MLREKKGITLIALVITIIVLLILAGVTIATLFGDNGVLTKAQQAVNEYNKGASDEQIKLSTIEQWMNQYETGSEIDFNEIINLRGIYEITFLNNEQILDCVRENNGELYREKIKVYLETKEIEILESRKVSELEEIAIPIYLILMENQDELQILGQIDENNIRVMYNHNLYIITEEVIREANEDATTIKISNDTLEIIEPDDINDWVYRIEDNNTVTILGYRGEDTEIVIPNYINSMPVIRLEPDYQPGGNIGGGFNYSFWNPDDAVRRGYAYVNEKIKKITVSEGIQELGEEVFVGTWGVNEIKLPSTLRKIERKALAYIKPEEPCTINIPISVVEMEEEVTGFSPPPLYSTNLIINIEAEEIPGTWDPEWNTVGEDNVQVNLGVK